MFTPLSAGSKDQIVALLAPSLIADAFGQHTIWVVIANVAAMCEPLRGREFFSSGAMQSPASLRVSCDWRPDVLASWRVNWLGQHYDVVAAPIDVDARHRTLELMCSEVAK